jgi:hypothetical protein
MKKGVSLFIFCFFLVFGFLAVCCLFLSGLLGGAQKGHCYHDGKEREGGNQTNKDSREEW